MSTVLREQGIVTVYDQVVSLVAQRWAKAFHCKVTIHTSLEQNPWADPQQQCDIVGWQVSSAGNTMEWIFRAASRSRHRSWQGTPVCPLAVFTNTRL